MDENTANPQTEKPAIAHGADSDGFHVGYDNGYGYRPANGIDTATRACPIDGSPTSAPAAPTARYDAGLSAEATLVDPSFAPTVAVPVDAVLQAWASTDFAAADERRGARRGARPAAAAGGPRTRYR